MRNGNDAHGLYASRPQRIAGHVRTIMKILKLTRTSSLLLLISFLVAFFALLSIKKIVEYSSAPSKNKKCDFAYPPTTEQTPSHTLVITRSKPAFHLEQYGGYINDASCLNKTPIYGMVKITTVDDIRNALAFARAHDLKVTAAGERHSMGGQSFSRNGLILDMRLFNRIALDKKHMVLHAEAGTTWQQIQHYLDQRGLSVRAMQSIDIFTIGGSLSVNAHGVAQNPGPVAATVRSIQIMKSDGEIVTASPTENPDLFKHVIGGYGLFGVILSADIDVVNNEVYALHTTYINYKNFPDYYQKHVEDDKNVGLFYARLSVAPDRYLRETEVNIFTRFPYAGATPALQPDRHTRAERFVLNFSKTGVIGRWTRWFLEKHLKPHLQPCISRNQAIIRREPCLVTRNQEMYDPAGYLKEQLNDTDILQEYFIPHNKMPEFVDGMRNIVRADDANLLNVTIREVHKDAITALPYATQNMFAFVLYFNQRLNNHDSQVLQKTTSDLINLATNLNGTFYLPYQLYYSPEQLRKAYPEIDAFFAAKKKYDPSELFENRLYEKYAK